MFSHDEFILCCAQHTFWWGQAVSVDKDEHELVTQTELIILHTPPAPLGNLNASKQQGAVAYEVT